MNSCNASIVFADFAFSNASLLRNLIAFSAPGPSGLLRIYAFSASSEFPEVTFSNSSCSISIFASATLEFSGCLSMNCCNTGGENVAAAVLNISSSIRSSRSSMEA